MDKITVAVQCHTDARLQERPSENGLHIYFCADDFGVSKSSCDRIAACVNDGCLNKVSVLPNSELEDMKEKLKSLDGADLSVHLNLVEGRCVGNADELFLLSDADGYFKSTFLGLLVSSILHRKAFKQQAKAEIRAQIKKAIDIFPAGTPLFLDSHQHTHMIPAVFSALCEVISDDDLNVQYLRMPIEPTVPFLRCPSVFPDCLSINLIKCLVLRLCFWFDRKKYYKLNVPGTCFFGIMFSGDMSGKKVEKLLPEFIKYARKRNKNLEVLFHPGYISDDENTPYFKSIKFKKFYLSPGRRHEYDAVHHMPKV